MAKADSATKTVIGVFDHKTNTHYLGEELYQLSDL